MNPHVRLLPRRAAAAAGLLALLSSLPVVPSPALAASAITLVAELDPALDGGTWQLSTHAGTMQNDALVLRSGEIPGGQPLTITLTAEDVAASTSDVFVLDASRMLPGADGELRGLVSTAGIGLGPDDAALGTHVLAATTPKEVRMYTSVEELVEAQPRLRETGPSTTVDRHEAERAAVAERLAAIDDAQEAVGQDTGVTGPESAAPERAPASDQVVPSLEEGRARRAGALDVPPPLTPPEGCEDLACGTPVAVPAGSGGIATLLDEPETQSLAPEKVQIVDSEDIVGVRAFRGFSHQINGSRSTFTVEGGTLQNWTMGVRTEAGPFRVAGSVDRQVALNRRTTFPERKDGFLDGVNRPGFAAEFGRDTWRWEQRVVSRACFPITCVYADEIVRELRYDGGTLVPRYDGPIGYYKSPFEVSRGVWGVHTSYLPGAVERTALERGRSFANSASVRVDFPNSFGGASFSSAMKHQRTERVVIAMDFKASEALPFMGTWYRYDGNSGQTYDYWSCEWKDGWTGGSPCFEYDDRITGR